LIVFRDLDWFFVSLVFNEKAFLSCLEHGRQTQASDWQKNQKVFNNLGLSEDQRKNAQNNGNFKVNLGCRENFWDAVWTSLF
jgi:hypothetical protein